MASEQEILSPIDKKDLVSQAQELSLLKEKLEGTYFGSTQSSIREKASADVFNILCLSSGIAILNFPNMIAPGDGYIERLDGANFISYFGYPIIAVSLLMLVNRGRLIYNDFQTKKLIERIEKEERAEQASIIRDGIEKPRNTLK